MIEPVDAARCQDLERQLRDLLDAPDLHDRLSPGEIARFRELWRLAWTVAWSPRDRDGRIVVAASPDQRRWLA